MRLLFVLLILLGFPLLELSILIRLAGEYGWWLGAYLFAVALVGWLLIQEEKLAVFGRMFNIVDKGHSPLLALFTSARRVLAGVLLIIHGVVSDAIALILLLIPIPAPKSRRGEDDAIEGEWRREDE